MIRIERVRLPGGMQAFARHQDGAIVVYVSADLPAGERTTAIARALRAAPEAGWREPHCPVLLPALAGGARLRLVPESRWAYRGLAAVPAAVAAAVITLTLLGGAPASRPAATPRMPPVTPAAGQAGPPGTAHREGPGLRAGSGTSAPGSGSGGQAHGKTPGPGGAGPVPQGSGRPSPTPTTTKPGSPSPSPAPKPSPSPSQKSCVSVLGITVCL
jgi:hypothetical protein